jgi:hypothetical protein
VDMISSIVICHILGGQLVNLVVILVSLVLIWAYPMVLWNVVGGYAGSSSHIPVSSAITLDFSLIILVSSV